MATELTKDELTFAQRMLPHVIAGKSPVDAAKAVIEDDTRLFQALISERTFLAYGAQGDGGPLVLHERTQSAKGIASAFSHVVYDRLRALHTQAA